MSLIKKNTFSSILKRTFKIQTHMQLSHTATEITVSQLFFFKAKVPMYVASAKGQGLAATESN